MAVLRDQGSDFRKYILDANDNIGSNNHTVQGKLTITNLMNFPSEIQVCEMIMKAAEIANTFLKVLKRILQNLSLCGRNCESWNELIN